MNYPHPEQLNKAFANNHYPHVHMYVSRFGNIRQTGGLEHYALPGVHPEHWHEITFSEFVASAYPETLIVIDFINKHKRLPNFIAAHLPYQYHKDYAHA